MDWFDNLIPTGLWNRGVEEFHEDFSGVPWLTSFLALLGIVGLVMLAVSVDSMVIARGRGAIGGAIAGAVGR